MNLDFLALWDRLAAKIPYGLKKKLGFRDRAAEAELELKSVLSMWETGDRDYRVGLQGKATSALSYLPSDRLIALAGESRFEWLRLRSVEVLEHRALTPARLAALWKAVAAFETLRPRVAALAGARLAGQVPKDFPLDLLDAAADAGGLGEKTAVETLLERRPPNLERSLWFFHRGAKSMSLLAHICRELPKCDFNELMRHGPGIDEDGPLFAPFRKALATAAAGLPAPELGKAAQLYPEHAAALLDEVVRRLGHLSSPISPRQELKKDRPKRGDAEDLRELAERLLSHARLEEAEALIDEIVELELRRSRAGLAPLCGESVAAMLHRYPTGVVGARAAAALGQFGTRESVQALMEAASSLDENIRQRALEAIAAINARLSKKAAR